MLRSPTRSRLKLIPRVANVEQWARDGPLSTPEYKLLVNYNDKPVLTRPQHRFYFGPGYVEVVLDIHSWAYLARKAFSSYIPRLGTVVFENAFVIQASSSLTREWAQYVRFSTLNVTVQTSHDHLVFHSKILSAQAEDRVSSSITTAWCEGYSFDAHY